ncbi:MAG: hypothetical protein PUP91_05405 [Rhizonema sp. PD37]|nr:hypothetical protein [Rhizonema sp. PD37]
MTAPNCIWFTPAHTQNGLHKAITKVELLTIRLGAMGVFEQREVYER